MVEEAVAKEETKTSVFSGGAGRTVDPLRLESQLCFPLYAASKEIVRRYKPLLDELDLTYTQYITMMVMWARREVNVSELGEALYLDSGTLTPLLKKLEAKGYVERQRSESDGRELIVRLTKAGRELRERALAVPEAMGRCVPLEPADAAELYRLLHKLLQVLGLEGACGERA